MNGVEYDDFSGAYIKGLLLHFEYNSTKVTKLPSVVEDNSTKSIN